MPQPLRDLPDLRTQGGYQEIADRPECALRIAQVATAWAWLERSLENMFATVTGINEREAPPVSKAHRVAMAALNALDSLSARLGVIETWLEMEIPAAVEQFNVLARDIRRCAKGRNNVVHSCWAISDRYPDDLIRILNSGGLERWTTKDYDNIIRQIDVQSEYVRVFLDACRAMIGQAQPPEPTEQAPALPPKT